MGCSSCSTDGAAKGCKSNGNCGTGSCNKLNVYNWLSDMRLPDGQETYPIVEVRFKGSRKEFYRNRDKLNVKVGDIVAVESSPGHDIGTISLVGELVRFQLSRKGLDEDSNQIRTLYRFARQNDIDKWNELKMKEHDTMHRSRELALQLGLKMKLSDVEYQGDGKKATFYYTADERVDFRELIKKMADKFKVRIEMRQIGMRQEASRLGGIGSCGRELCCSTWLTSFKAVSTSSARYQNLSLNPIKLAGQCGKLKCCLNYELDSYLDALKDIPPTNIKLETKKGIAKHCKTDIFKRLMWYVYVSFKKDSGDNGYVSAEWTALPVERVKEIIELNKQKKLPDDLADGTDAVDVKALDYADVVGQDSLTRMDKKKGKSRSKKRRKKPQRRDKQQKKSNRN